MNPSEARHFNNDAKPGELKLQIRDDEDNSHQGYESRKIFAAVSHMKEIGLSLQTVFLSKLPNVGQNVERNQVHQRLVTENKQNRSTLGVCPATNSEECERGIDFPGHQ